MDENRVPLSDVKGAPISVEVEVDVLAVTDGANLTLNELTFDVQEDSTIDLSKYFAANLLNVDGNLSNDTDGSEQYWYSVSGLPEGTVVKINGEGYTANAEGVVTTPANKDFVSKPKILIEPPKDFSGEIKNITVTLNSQDIDSDSNTNGAVKESFVTLQLNVTPKAGDVEAKDVTTQEDTAVAFLQHVRVTDNATGNEVIDSVSFTVPMSGGAWKVIEPKANPTNLADGYTIVIIKDDTEYSIVFNSDSGNGRVLNEADRESILKAFKIQPPAHSSNDATIKLIVTSTDKNTTGTDTASKLLDVKVTVNPVAEITFIDSDGDKEFDVKMVGNHDYTTSGKEDTWFALGINNTNAVGGIWSGLGAEGVWKNQDSDEFNYAVLTPIMTNGWSGDNAINSTFRWFDGSTWHEVTYTDGQPVWVPTQYLNTLQFMPPKDVSGTFKIEVQVGTVDYKDDSEGDSTHDMNNPPKESVTGVVSVFVSGKAELTTIVFEPVADEVTLALNGRATGVEDTPIALFINPTSSDKSEIYVVNIAKIPSGATIIYDGVELPVNNGQVEIENFDASKSLTIQPPKDSNVNFTLEVSASSKDGNDISDVKVLPIDVTVIGKADAAKIELKNPADYVEAALDNKLVKVQLSELVSVKLTDTDGSEKLTIRITDLPKGFSLSEGTLLISGEGTERVWILTPEQFTKAYINVPKHYSGQTLFKVAGVTTENDGDSLTGKSSVVGFTVKPSAEAITTTHANIVEDEVTSLGFGIVHQGDTDEKLGKVLILKSDAAQSDKFTLYLDGKTLSNSNLTEVTRDGKTYYELSAEQATKLAAKGATNKDGSLGSFQYKYEIIDDSYGTKPSGATDTVEKDGVFTIVATAVTDKINLSINDVTGGSDDDNDVSTTTVKQVGEVTVNLNVTSNDPDGSEHVIRVLVENVPNGVMVVGAEQIGNNSWLLVYEGNDAKSIAANGVGVPVQFYVGALAPTATTDIKITVQAQDNGNQVNPNTNIVSENVIWKLATDIATAPGNDAPIITFERNNEFATEDTSFTLDKILDATVKIQDSSQVNVFTVTLENVPEGVTVSGMTLTYIDGKPVWTKSVTVEKGSNAQAEAETKLYDLLNNIVITPSPDSNENNAPGILKFDARLTSSVMGGETRVVSIEDMVIPVASVTDEAQLTISVTDVGEGTTDIPVNITVNTGKDATYGEIVGGKLYLKVDDSTTAGLQGGILKNSKGEIILTDIKGESGIPDGQYYVIDVGSAGGSFDLTYTPPVSKPGDIRFDAWVVTKEDDVKDLSKAQNYTTNESGQGQIQIINNGVTFTNQPVIGNEATSSNPNQAILLDGLKVELKDVDFETIDVIKLSGLPVGFLVYIDNGSGGLALAENAGGDGITNTWILSQSGDLSQVSILPPRHWSGTLSDLQLVVESGDTRLSENMVETITLEPFTVNPKANGVSLKVTQTFGNENAIIPLNLNASMQDPKVVDINGYSDGSYETTTLKITGLGEYASFYLGDKRYDKVVYNKQDDSYTVTGLTQNDLDKLGFLQAVNSIRDQNVNEAGVQIKVEGWTVETDAENGTILDISEVNSANITLKIFVQKADNNDNKLIWTGTTINGGGGNDTVVLRAGENLQGTVLATNLKNIEILDLSVAGKNTIGMLTADQVNSMTDTRNVLKINGTAEDQITLASGWTKGSIENGYVTYTAQSNGADVTLQVSVIVNVTSSELKAARAFATDTSIYDVLGAVKTDSTDGIETWSDFELGHPKSDALKFSSEFFEGLLEGDLTEDNLSQVSKFISVEYDSEQQQATIFVDRDGADVHYGLEKLAVLVDQPNHFGLKELIDNQQIIIG